jgi:SMODS-associated and fused to various effectors sensor domain
MGQQSASRLAGDDYQHLYSWFELLQLLPTDSPYSHGYVEHPHAGAADDVTLHPKDNGRPAKYVQVKFHVDHSAAYSGSKLVEVQAAEARSVLHKLFDSWRMLKEQEPGGVEIWLVSNWASAEDLGEFLLESFCLSKNFFTGGPKSKACKLRTLWAEQLGAREEELAEFCRALRLRLGFAGMGELTERVDERMKVNGLRMGKVPQDLAIGIVRGWIQAGGENKRISRSEFEKAIAERGLRSDAAEIPKATLIIHAWDRRYFDVPPTIELDWTRFFDFESRSMPKQEVWMDALLPELKRAKAQLAGIPGANFIEFRGKLPLSALLVVGRTFPEGGGFRLRVEQPTGGETHLWRSDAPASPFETTVSETPIEGPGIDLLVSVSLTGDASADVQKLLSEEQRFKLWVDVKPASGASSTSVKSAGEVTAIALETKELLRQFRLRSGAEKIGLILYCPASVALFIGQRLNALGEVVAYERRAAGGYQEAVVIQTG